MTIGIGIPSANISLSEWEIKGTSVPLFSYGTGKRAVPYGIYWHTGAFDLPLWHNMHLVLLQHIEEQASVPHLYTVSCIPRPSHRPVFDCLQCNQKLDDGKTRNEANLQLQSVYGKWNWHEETTHELTRAVLATVAQKLQQERALLLPHAVSCFLDNCLQAKDNEEM